MSHDHGQENKARNVVFVLASAALVATALLSQRPAHAPAPDLETAFRATALPQPDARCRIEAYNAKGGVLAKQQLICTVSGKEVKRSLPDVTAGTSADHASYYVVARPNEDTVLLASGVADEGTPPPDPQFWFYSFKTWKTVPFKAATDTVDAWGWQSLVVSPDSQRIAWAPAHQEGFARTLYVADLAARTMRDVVTVSPPESFAAAVDTVPAERLGWKDNRTVVYGVWNAFDLTDLREVTVQ